MSKKYNSPNILIIALTALTAMLPFSACSSNNEPQPVPDIVNGLNVDKLMEVKTNPSMDEMIVEYEGFIVSFNPTMHLPNWVAWTVTRDKMNRSNLSRVDNFRPDDRVPGCATLEDYRYSGYDRGHMAPSGDMRWSEEAMDNACYLTNICPQLNELNNGAWKNLEEKCRKNATRDGTLIVICGPVLTEGFKKTIGKTPVPVPPSYFKVILTPGGSGNTGTPSAIGFLMPNDYVEGGMQKAAVSVDEIERLTGHDFFAELPDNIEAEAESALDFNHFSTGRISRRSRK